MKVTFGTVTDRGLNPKRAANEDRLLVLEDRGLFLVADGVGGRRGGQVASQTVVDVFVETFSKATQKGIALALEAAIIESNRRIFQQSLSRAELEGMATTVVVLAIDGCEAAIGHVGDSRLYRFENGRLSAETEDHSEVVEAVRAGVISAAMAARDPLRNVLTRAVGAEQDVEPTLRPIPISDGVRFLLCSDGITRHIPDLALSELLARALHPQQICEILKQRCYEAGAEDNLTAVVVDLGDVSYLSSDAMSVEPDGAASQGTRIEVDFRALPPPAPTSLDGKREGEAGEERSPIAATRGGAGRVLRNVFVLATVVLLGIIIGRYYDEGRVWISNLIGARPSEQPAQGAVTPALVDPDLAAARVLFQEKRFEKARDQLTELKRRSPENAEYHFWLGLTEYELKDYPEAIKDLNEAARLDGHLPEIFAHLARAYSAIGDRRNADESLRRERETAGSGR